MATTYVRNPDTGNFELVGPGGATTDTTLSQTGKPADAAAVGSALSNYSLLSHGHTEYAQLHDVRLLGAHNFLDNSNFINPVNQRKNVSYTSAGYTIDRWKISDGSTVTVNDGSVTVDGTMTQYVSGLPYGKIYTFAYGNDVSTAIGTVGYDSSMLCHHVSVPSGTWKWAALYDGEYTIDTLPYYAPKGYAVELLECKRYLQICPYNYTFLFGTSGAADGTGARMMVPLHIPMFVDEPNVPAFVVNISTHEGYVKQATFTPSVVRANGPWLSLYGNLSATASSTSYVAISAQLRNADLIVSAEL